jgi:hypothetical protein
MGAKNNDHQSGGDFFSDCGSTQTVLGQLLPDEFDVSADPKWIRSSLGADDHKLRQGGNHRILVGMQKLHAAANQFRFERAIATGLEEDAVGLPIVRLDQPSWFSFMTGSPYEMPVSMR